MSRLLGPAIHQAYVYPDFEAGADPIRVARPPVGKSEHG